MIINPEIFLNAVVAYFVIMDPLGVSLVFNSLTSPRPASESRNIAIRATALSLFIILGFGFFGTQLLSRLGITIEAFRIAGGLLLFYSAFSMVVRPDTSSESDNFEPAGDIIVFPLSIPLIAGPGCLTLTILLFSKAGAVEGGLLSTTLAIFVILLLTLILLFLSRKIARIIGETANSIIKRLLGVLLASLAVQFIADGIIGLAS